jgi:hypothetical protein
MITGISKLDDTVDQLKALVQSFESDSFLSDIAALIIHLDYGVLPYQPFDKLHSLPRQNILFDWPERVR